MYLLVTATECNELLELSYACSSGSLKNGETWFDTDRWKAGVSGIIGEEEFAKLPPKGEVQIVVWRNGPLPMRLCETLPHDPVSEITKSIMKNLYIDCPRDFFKELQGLHF